MFKKGDYLKRRDLTPSLYPVTGCNLKVVGHPPLMPPQMPVDWTAPYTAIMVDDRCCEVTQNGLLMHTDANFWIHLWGLAPQQPQAVVVPQPPKAEEGWVFVMGQPVVAQNVNVKRGPHKCQCPLEGPDGLLAQGCKCNGL